MLVSRVVSLRDGVTTKSRGLLFPKIPLKRGSVQVKAPFEFAGDSFKMLPFRVRSGQILPRTSAGLANFRLPKRPLNTLPTHLSP